MKKLRPAMVKCPHCDKVTYPGAIQTHIRYMHDDEAAAERFWGAVDKNGAGGCWLYKLGRDKWGYGDLRWRNRHLQAHRLAWLLTHGDPGEKDVLHTCHNPPCCNPAHLKLGTDADNVSDRIKAGHLGHRYMPIEDLRYPHLSRRREKS